MARNEALSVLKTTVASMDERSQILPEMWLDSGDKLYAPFPPYELALKGITKVH